MLLISLLIVPIIGILVISLLENKVYEVEPFIGHKDNKLTLKIGLATSIINLIISLIIYIIFDFSSKQFQFVQEYHKVNNFDLYLGIDGLSIYFILLTTIIMPLAILSN
jgi:NADH-ubiquinone oxidoreductase chain 4